MSRSRRTNPFHGVTTARSEIYDKRKWAKQYRATVSVDISTESISPLRRCNDRDGRKDGKFRFDPAISPKLMRK